MKDYLHPFNFLMSRLTFRWIEVRKRSVIYTYFLSQLGSITSYMFFHRLFIYMHIVQHWV